MICNKCGTPLHLSSNACSVCGSITAAKDCCSYETSKPLMAIIKTITDLLIRPKQFFSVLRVKPGKNHLDPLIFALFCTGIAISAHFLWSRLLPSGPDALDQIIHHTYTDSFNLILSPLTLIFRLILLTIYVYGMALIFRVKKRDFSHTFQIAAYSQAAFLFNLVPAAGEFISNFFWIYLFILGISTVYRISVAKTLFIVFSPVLVLLFLALITYMLILLSGFPVEPFFEHLILNLS